MARTKQTPLIATRVAVKDYLRLEQVCRLEGKTKTEILRRATLQYLDRYDQGIEGEIRDELAETLKAMEGQRRKDTERLAKIMARVMMDVATLNQVLFSRAAPDERQDIWMKAKQGAIQRLQGIRKKGDPEAAEIVANALSGET